MSAIWQMAITFGPKKQADLSARAAFILDKSGAVSVILETLMLASML